jgi:hypothetical protein
MRVPSQFENPLCSEVDTELFSLRRVLMTRHLMQRRYAIDVLILPSVLNGHYTMKYLAFGAGQVIVTAEN